MPAAGGGGCSELSAEVRLLTGRTFTTAEDHLILDRWAAFNRVGDKRPTWRFPRRPSDQS